MRKVTIILVVVLAVASLGLIRYFHRQTVMANGNASLAKQEASKADLRVLEDKGNSNCNLAWLKFQNEKEEGKLIKLEQGPIAYDKHEAKILGDEPICGPDPGDENMDDAINESTRIMDDMHRARKLHEAEKFWANYATDRKAQTRHLFHELL